MPSAISDFPEPVGVVMMALSPGRIASSYSSWCGYSESPESSTQVVKISRRESGEGSWGKRSLRLVMAFSILPCPMLGIARGEDGESNGVNYGKCGFITWSRRPLSSGVMPELWTVERIEAAAPASSSAPAGRKLAKPGPWSAIGFQGHLLWGAC